MIPVVIAVFVMVLVSIFPHVVPIPVVAVAISVSIASLSVSSATVIAVMVVCITPVGRVALIVAEARVIAEAGFILPSPFPIFPLALTVEAVVLHVVVAPLGQPLPVIRIVVSVVAACAVVGIVS